MHALILTLQSACQAEVLWHRVLEVSGGGAFLIVSLNPDDLFTPEDWSDEQRLFGRTVDIARVYTSDAMDRVAEQILVFNRGHHKVKTSA